MHFKKNKLDELYNRGEKYEYNFVVVHSGKKTALIPEHFTPSCTDRRVEATKHQTNLSSIELDNCSIAPCTSFSTPRANSSPRCQAEDTGHASLSKPSRDVPTDP